MTIIDETNVVRFEPRPPPPAPALQFVDVRLNVETCGLTLSARDHAGRVITFEYALVSSPGEAELALLCRSWEEWRGCSTEAS